MEEIKEKSILESAIGEIDYAILKSISYHVKTISDIVKVLQIRTITIEKHVYMLVNKGFINFDFEFNITTKGIDAISTFERENPNVWKSIDDFIISVIKHQKEQKVKMYRIIDIVLLVLMIILIILIIYFLKDLLVTPGSNPT